MTASLAPVEDETVAICDTAADLAAIRNPGTELAIWQRRQSAGLRRWLDGLDAAQLPHLRVLMRPSDVRAALTPHLDDCDMSAGEGREALLADIEDLVLAYAVITGSGLVDMRLERVSHDACWKFHRDRVEARLLVTYRGAATEWVQQAHGALALREQKSFTGPIERLARHDVALFKGNCAGEGSGIVHRSPPISGTGQTRLLLCLNMPSEVSPEPWEP